jgi:predicted nicotinamide N-methyase
MNKTASDDLSMQEHVGKIRAVKNQEWLSLLGSRKRKELEFHDRGRQNGVAEGTDTCDKFYGNRKYYVATASSGARTANWIAKRGKDKVFLDYACGNGANAIAAASLLHAADAVLTRLPLVQCLA